MGQVLNGRYELEQRIGDGGMAVVYQGRDLVLGRLVAVKALRDQYVADAGFISRFRREAQSAAALSHPNIVNIYDVGEDAGLHYIVMEYVPGRNLKDLIRAEGTLGARQAVDLGRQICAALGYAHQRGLVHRDIKPQNILVTPEGHVKVADFGIAKGLHDINLTATGIAMGTVHYASPEQVEGKEATPASDIYAAGVVLYEMLTGRLPFDGETPVSIALKHINETPLRLRAFNPQVPAGLETVVLTALSKRPEDRFPTADAFGQALADYQYYSSPRTAATLAAGARTAAVPIQRLPGGGRAAGSSPPVAGRTTLDSRSGATPRATAASRRRRVGSAARPRDDIGCLTWVAGAIGLGLLLGLTFVAFTYLPRIVGTVIPPAPTSTITSQAGKPATPGGGLPGGIATPAPGAPTRPAGAIGATTATATATLATTATVTTTATASTPTITATSTGTATPTATATPLPRLPDLRGRTLEEAQQAVQAFGVSLVETKPGVFSDRVPAGRIVDQNPAPETPVPAGSTVRVILSRGKAVTVPELRNQEAELAAKLLSDLGLASKRLEEPSREVATGRVIRTDPVAGAPTAAGSTVTLVISVGDQVRVPDIFNKPLAEAKQILEEAGLQLGPVAEQTRDMVPPDQRAAFDRVGPGHILSASPNYGTLMPRGSRITVAVRKP
ncbi:MAG: protein kinase [Chloroflexi bacterium]|nr:protein kinase [Chloroflexota bacterium]